MSSDEAIRIAAVVASLTAVLVTVLLFLIREIVDSRRRRKRAGTTLLLYAAIIARAFSRNSLNPLPFGMREVLDASGEVVHVPECALLLAALDEGIHVLAGAATSRTPLQREERERLITAITAACK